MDIKKQYDRIGQKYIEGQQEFFSRKEDVARIFIKKSLPNIKDKIVLDVGCGHGKDIEEYEKLGKARIFGIDTSKFMAKQAKKRVKQPENIFIQDIAKTSFKDDFFDIVVSRYALHYLKHVDSAFKEIARILKKGGTFIFVVHHPLKDYLHNKQKSYGKAIIKKPLYNNQVEISFPAHTFEEYLSQEFLKNFIIEEFKEYKSPEEKDNYAIPGSIAIKATRR